MFKLLYAILLLFFINFAYGQDNTNQLPPIPREQVQWEKLPNLAFKEGEEPLLIFYSDCDEQGKYLSVLRAVNEIYVVFTIHKNGKIVSARSNFQNQNIQLGKSLTKRLLKARFKPVSVPKHLLQDGKYYTAALRLRADTKMPAITRPTPECRTIREKLATETTQTP